MTDKDMMDMVDQQESPDQLPFINLAWQNKHRSVRQFCFMRYGARYKNSEAYFVKYEWNKTKGYHVFGMTSEWKHLKESSAGAP